MTATSIYGSSVTPLAALEFGCVVDLNGVGALRWIEIAEQDPGPLLELFYSRNGLMVLQGMEGIARRPELMVRLSAIFGPEVEDYRATLTSSQFFHDSVDQILVLFNRPPCSYEPPPEPRPPRTADGSLPVTYPHRRGWHTDQSYRRPPPDVTLLLGLVCPPPDQGQTLYADCLAAYRDLSSSLRHRVRGLQGIHALRWTGRSRQEVEAGTPRQPLLAHQFPQRQPVVRRHAEHGRLTLYLCDDEQMDFIDGPFVGMAPGPDGEGDRLLQALLEHTTRPANVYVHAWRRGDLVIHDNRNMLHTATWYDSKRYTRLMWRTTVMGNPGVEYAGEAKSWIPHDDATPMQGLEDIKY